jgi:anti-sigma B factor antagonist
MYLSFSVPGQSPDAVIEVTGDIDFLSAPWLQEQLLHILRTSGDHLLVDLSGVSFIDCAGLRTLLGTCRNAEQQSRSVSFVAVSYHVRRVAELAGVPEAVRLTTRQPAEPCYAGAAGR